MSSCLGIYVDKNLIKYAKLKKVRDTFKVEAFNVEVFENLEKALIKVIDETNSYKVPISINISNELYYSKLCLDGIFSCTIFIWSSYYYVGKKI